MVRRVRLLFNPENNIAVVRMSPLATILKLGFYDNEFILWFLIDSDVENRDARYFQAIPTDHPIPDGSTYIDSFSSGALHTQLHIFEVPQAVHQIWLASQVKELWKSIGQRFADGLQSTVEEGSP